MPQAMGLVVLEGLVITALVLTGIRKRVFEAVPPQLKQAIVIGIGFFVLFLGLVNGGVVVKGSGAPVALGDLSSASVLLTAAGAGFMSYVALRVAQGEARKVHPLLYVFTGVFLAFFLEPLLDKLFG